MLHVFSQPTSMTAEDPLSLSLPLGMLHAQVSMDMSTREERFRVEGASEYEIRLASQTSTAFHRASQ
jgi:hypothetical protein